MKVVSDFDFEQFLTLLMEYPAPLTEKGPMVDFDFPLFSYTRAPSFMPPIHFWCSPSRKGPGEPEASRPAGRYNAKFDKPNVLLENCR